MFDRRKFLSYIPAATTLAALGALAQASAAAPAQGYHGVGAIETIMRGHGLLLRALIIYDTLRERIAKGQQTDPALVLKTVGVFHDYLEGFHETMEEKYIFLPMEKNNVCFPSIQELKIQHGSGYELTQRITKLAKAGTLDSELSGYISDFLRMYMHHAAWEDSVVFPAFDNMERKTELDALAATFAVEEEKILGHDGFESFVNKIADVEKQLGIYELSTSTPKLR